MAENKVENGHFVKVHYTGTFTDGTVFDSSEGKQALEVLAGQGMLIKGFDEALIGMEVGEEKEVDISSENAYGEKRAELVKEVPKKDLGADIKPEIGMVLGIKAPTGQVFPATITEVKEDSIMLDANHPLAGKDLHFKLKVEETRKPTDDDLAKFAPPVHEHGDHCESCSSDHCDTC
jgi:FKBP-type peptidyl-prolyl cis-trans isomerase 2